MQNGSDFFPYTFGAIYIYQYEEGKCYIICKYFVTVQSKEYTQKLFILAICLTLTLSSITLLFKKKSPKIESKLK